MHQWFGDLELEFKLEHNQNFFFFSITNTLASVITKFYAIDILMSMIYDKYFLNRKDGLNVHHY